MKTIEIDQEKLTEYVIGECMFLTKSFEGTRHCRKKMSDLCGIPDYMRDDCPEDCPRRYTLESRCDGAKCKSIKNIIKRLKPDRE